MGQRPAKILERRPARSPRHPRPHDQTFYEDQEQKQRDEAMRSIGIGAQTLMLGAKAMGYDSCPMIGFDADAVANFINLPEDMWSV